ncbi:MAG TPA: NADH-quinone oxidoreductase subunit J [Gemmatimonadaceae bacterium]|nr:NADH-quinone oxidoreductase subunit J [Gemmatimonadaceae bacterium]
MTLFYQFHFYLFGLLAVASAAIFVTRRSPVAAALWLVNVLMALAAMFVMLGADFVGAIQVLLYAGAIMVVFLFVVMLLNLGHPDEIGDLRDHRWRLGAGAVALLLAAELLVVLRDPLPEPTVATTSLAAPPTANAVTPIAEVFFREYLVAFEFASVLLLAAIVAAVALAKRNVRA